MTPTLEVRDLTKEFAVTASPLSRRVTQVVRAVDRLNFAVSPGETLGLVGESGCGKTTTARMILKLLKPTSGSIHCEGEDVTDAKGADLARFRSRVQAVFQDPYSSLSPRAKIREIICEPITSERLSKQEREDVARRLLKLVGLPENSVNRYPHEFSGGQRQRIAIARSLSVQPKLLVLDEPISALDVSISAQILNLLMDLQQELGTSYLLISHSLSAIRHMSNSVVIMYLGKEVESGMGAEVFAGPMHPYTQALLAAAPPDHPRDRRTKPILEGEVPSVTAPPSGCVFRTRCPMVMPICETTPALLDQGNRLVACHLYGAPVGAPEKR